jgi:hypothetical protein
LASRKEGNRLTERKSFTLALKMSLPMKLPTEELEEDTNMLYLDESLQNLKMTIAEQQ